MPGTNGSGLVVLVLTVAAPAAGAGAVRRRRCPARVARWQRSAGAARATGALLVLLLADADQRLADELGRRRQRLLVRRACPCPTWCRAIPACSRRCAPSHHMLALAADRGAGPARRRRRAPRCAARATASSAACGLSEEPDALPGRSSLLLAARARPPSPGRRTPGRSIRATSSLTFSASQVGAIVSGRFPTGPARSCSIPQRWPPRASTSGSRCDRSRPTIATSIR